MLEIKPFGFIGSMYSNGKISGETFTSLVIIKGSEFEPYIASTKYALHPSSGLSIEDIYLPSALILIDFDFQLLPITSSLKSLLEGLSAHHNLTSEGWLSEVNSICPFLRKFQLYSGLGELFNILI